MNRGAYLVFNKFSLSSVSFSFFIVVAALIVIVLFLITILLHPSILISSPAAYNEGDFTNSMLTKCIEGRNSTTPLVGCFICNIRDNQYNELHLSRVFSSSDRKTRFRDNDNKSNSISQNPSLRLGQNTELMKNISNTPVKSVQGIFDSIYNGNIWTPAGGGSGVGSDEGFAVSASHILQLVSLRFGVTRMLDAPCGGVHSSWMNTTLRRIKESIPCFTYLGVDVVPSVVQKNREGFAKHSSWVRFAEMDLSSPSSSSSSSSSHGSISNASSSSSNVQMRSLPSGFHLVLSRDALQHLSYVAIAEALRNYCLSRAAYLLVGSYLLPAADGHSKNRDIAVGETFSIDLLSEPFSFKDPVEVFPERPIGPFSDAVPENAKFLVLFRLPKLCASAELQAFVSQHRAAAEQ